MKKQGARGDFLPNCQKVDTAAKLVEAHGVSSRTIIRDGKKAEAVEKFAQAAPEQAIQHCRVYAYEAERRMGEMLRETERAKGELKRDPVAARFVRVCGQRGAEQ